jgi:flagellar basal-body rod protein FlgB
MLSTMFDSTTIPVLEQVVNFAQTRHGILAGNIANLDTPGYRVRDLSPEAFEARLKQAIENRDQSAPAGSLAGADFTPERPLAGVGSSLEDILYHDDSTGSLEKQIAAISKNQMQHNLALSILTSQFRLLQAAISERA